MLLHEGVNLPTTESHEKELSGTQHTGPANRPCHHHPPQVTWERRDSHDRRQITSNLPPRVELLAQWCRPLGHIPSVQNREQAETVTCTKTPHQYPLTILVHVQLPFRRRRPQRAKSEVSTTSNYKIDTKGHIFSLFATHTALLSHTSKT